MTSTGAPLLHLLDTWVDDYLASLSEWRQSRFNRHDRPYRLSSTTTHESMPCPYSPLIAFGPIETLTQSLFGISFEAKDSPPRADHLQQGSAGRIFEQLALALESVSPTLSQTKLQLVEESGLLVFQSGPQDGYRWANLIRPVGEPDPPVLGAAPGTDWTPQDASVSAHALQWVLRARVIDGPLAVVTTTLAQWNQLRRRLMRLPLARWDWPEGGSSLYTDQDALIIEVSSQQLWIWSESGDVESLLARYGLHDCPRLH